MSRSSRARCAPAPLCSRGSIALSLAPGTTRPGWPDRPTLGREFRRVGEEIDENLLDALAIAQRPHRWWLLELERQSPSPNEIAHHVARSMHQRRDGAGLDVELEVPCLDAREVQNV